MLGSLAFRTDLTMAAYHDGSRVTASFVSLVLEHGLSGALASRRVPGLELRVPILIGTAVHILAQGGRPWAPDGPIVVFPGSRRSKEWRICKAAWSYAVTQGATAEGMLTMDDALVACKAWSSLCGPDPSTAKIQAKNLLTSREQVSEATYEWEPIKGLTCAVRPDIVVRRNGQIIAVPIKTTSNTLTWDKWWRMWRGTRDHPGWITSACMHWYGLAHANGGTPVPQIWITVRTGHGFPWSTVRIGGPDDGREHLWRGQSALELMEEHWHEEIIPALETIRDWRSVGYGPEEAGIQG